MNGRSAELFFTDSLEAEFVEIASRRFPVIYSRHPRARRYVLRLRDEAVHVTIPRSGSKKFAREFIAGRREWLERQWGLLQRQGAPPKKLRPGDTVLFRGSPAQLQLDTSPGGLILFLGELSIGTILDGAEDLRPVVECYLFCLARCELPPRVVELARQHNALVRRISVRNQRRRWGSCSQRGTISLNWRLVQTPEFVRDYIILHELMHLREMNHSARFWQHVQSACPAYLEAEAWLKTNSARLGF
jgi:predicted metal-dependent hydrolase